MTHRRTRVALIVVSIFLSFSLLQGREPLTQVLFGLDSTETSPFPSDLFTIPDPAQNTGRRVALPKPDDCGVSDCEDLDVINELDGFNLQPRLSVPFSGPIDVGSVTSKTVFLLSLGSTLPEADDVSLGTIIGIDQIVWDPATNTLHAESDALLAQHTRFALIVTSGVRDAGGLSVRTTGAFPQFRAFVREDYRQELVVAIQAAHRVGLEQNDITVASVFTTQSATAILEKIRDQINDAAAPAPADFGLGPNGMRTVFNFSDVTTITLRQQTTTSDPPAFTSGSVNLGQIRTFFPGTVATVGFGKYRSPDYEVHPGEYIPPVGTRSGTPEVQETNEIYFNVFLPSVAPGRPKPVNGWPVAIFGHAMGQDKNTTSLVGSNAAHGIATISINAVGHGFGPLSTLTVNRAVGGPITFLAGGRGIDQNGDGRIDSFEGMVTAPPRLLALYRDGFRQTAADLMQLVRVIEVGMDVDGNGQPDLDASRIYYSGQSLGSGYGTVFVAVEPDVRVGVFPAPITPAVVAPLSVPQRGTLGTVLASRHLLNTKTPGIKAFNAPATPTELVPLDAPYFDENQPLRDRVPLTVQLEDDTTRIVQSPVTNSIPGAMAIQQRLDALEWAEQPGSPIAHAPHLRNAPLRGVPVKSVIFQIAKGDQSAPDPTTTALLRAGDLADRTLYYRHDLAWLDHGPTLFPNLPKNPHSFAVNINLFGAIALGAQEQTSKFFESDGTVTIQPGPSRYFEFPIAGGLPEDLNYIP